VPQKGNFKIDSFQSADNRKKKRGNMISPTRRGKGGGGELDLRVVHNYSARKFLGNVAYRED